MRRIIKKATIRDYKLLKVEQTHQIDAKYN